MPAAQYNQYQQNAIAQAEPVKLVGMLYKGAIQFMRRAEKSIADADFESAHNNIMRAYAIVAELMATLDFEQGGEIAPKLEQCYDFVLFLLKDANIKKDPQLIAQARDVIEPLLATWEEAFSGKAPQPQPAANPAVNEVPQPQAAPVDSAESKLPGTASPPATPGLRKPLDLVG